MTVRILRRPKAAQDAESIADYIAETSLKAAVRFLENTESTLMELAESPGAGSAFESVHPELADLRFRRVKGFPNHFYGSGRAVGATTFTFTVTGSLALRPSIT